jgi:hypothetical protein
MQTIKKYWPYALVAVVAAAIPVSALFVEPAAETVASDEKFENGILRRPDNPGDVWTLQQAGGRSALTFRKPGSPITVKTDVRRVNSGMVTIGLVLKGRAGETYRPTIKKNNGALSAPGLRIIDKQGKVVDEGTFAYG